MNQHRLRASVFVAVVTAIGCGGSRPQDAAATTDEAAGKDRSAQATPMQLAQATPETQAAAGSGSVKGVVKFSGTAPAREKIKMDADPVCQQQHAEAVYSEAVVVNDNGTLRNVFVYVKEGVSGSYPAPSAPVVLNQKGCQYSPHVAGIQVNQLFEVVNSDGTLHNINAKPAQNKPFNVAQPVQGMKTTKSFATPEVMVKFKCNVHPWMNAYLGVLTHPFFSVSSADGSFTINGLPAGTYTLEAWHETYGTQTQQVTVAEGQTQSVDFTFSPQ